MISWKKLAFVALVSTSVTSCSYYHAWNGISYMMHETRDLKKSSSDYLQGNWKKSPASPEENMAVQARVRRGYISDVAVLLTQFGGSQWVQKSIAESSDKVNIQFGKTYRYTQGNRYYFCTTFLVLDQDGSNRAKNTITPIFVEVNKDPNIANADQALVKNLCH